MQKVKITTLGRLKWLSLFSMFSCKRTGYSWRVGADLSVPEVGDPAVEVDGLPHGRHHGVVGGAAHQPRQRARARPAPRHAHAHARPAWEDKLGFLELRLLLWKPCWFIISLFSSYYSHLISHQTWVCSKIINDHNQTLSSSFDGLVALHLWKSPCIYEFPTSSYFNH